MPECQWSGGCGRHGITQTLGVVASISNSALVRMPTTAFVAEPFGASSRLTQKSDVVPFFTLAVQERRVEALHHLAVRLGRLDESVHDRIAADARRQGRLPAGHPRRFALPTEDVVVEGR